MEQKLYDAASKLPEPDLDFYAIQPVYSFPTPHKTWRTIASLAACFILLITIGFISFCTRGSAPHTAAEPVSFPEANFNNNYWFSGDFWAFDDQVFYLQDGFYNMGAYWSINGRNEKIFEESDFASDPANPFYIGDIFVCDRWLYFELRSTQKDMLYRYDLNEGTYAPVCEIPYLYRWVVVDHYFIYREHPTNNPEKHSPLWIYDLQDGTTTQVCSNVEEFGIVDGQLRYITYADIYKLYQYDYLEDTSHTLGAFSCKLDSKYDIFNFTPDSVVMLNWGEYDRNLVVYTLSSGATATYTLPKGIHNMVAYDQYAYAVVYDTKKNSSEAAAAKENGIYRINLTDGSYECVEYDADDDTEIHVVSDDHVYIIQRKMNGLFQSRRHVYLFDHATGNKEKLTVI